MKTKQELLGDLIFYPIVVIFCIVCISLVPLVVAIVLICVIAVIVIMITYAFFYAIFGGLWFCIDYLFIVHKENISGKVIALRSKPELFFIPTNNNGNSENYIYLIPDQIIIITNYFLKIKKGVQWYTVKVPQYVFQKIEEQVKAGIRTIELPCEKHGYNEFYELSSNSPS